MELLAAMTAGAEGSPLAGAVTNADQVGMVVSGFLAQEYERRYPKRKMASR